MAKLSYEQFRTEVVENIKAYLPEEYNDYKISLEKIVKASEEYEGLIIKPENEKFSCVPTLNLTRSYEDYMNDMPLEEVIMFLADVRMHAKYPKFNMPDLTNYEKVKDMILPRLINRKNNKEYLENKPHTNVSDLAVVYSIRLQETDGFSDAVITEPLMEALKITKKKLHEVAMDNLAKREPLFLQIEQAMTHTREKSLDIEEIDLADYDAPLFVLSNKQTTLGAVNAINPAVMDKIYNNFGKIFVIPSSIHEVLIIPQAQIANVKDLKAIAMGVNASSVDPKERLSDNIYEYDIEKHTITIAK